MSDFVELPIYLIDGKLKDLDVPTEDIPAKLMVRTDAILAYREAMHDNGDMSQTAIYLSTNDSYVIDMTYESFKQFITLRIANTRR